MLYTESDKKRLKRIIRSQGGEFNYYLNIYLKYMKSPGCSKHDVVAGCGLSIKELKEEADRWSLMLHDGGYIPIEYYGYLYGYLNYLADKQYAKNGFSFPW